MEKANEKIENFYREVDILRMKKIQYLKIRMHWKGLTADWTIGEKAHELEDWSIKLSKLGNREKRMRKNRAQCERHVGQY